MFFGFNRRQSRYLRWSYRARYNGENARMKFLFISYTSCCEHAALLFIHYLRVPRLWTCLFSDFYYFPRRFRWIYNVPKTVFLPNIRVVSRAYSSWEKANVPKVNRGFRRRPSLRTRRLSDSPRRFSHVRAIIGLWCVRMHLSRVSVRGTYDWHSSRLYVYFFLSRFYFFHSLIFLFLRKFFSNSVNRDVIINWIDVDHFCLTMYISRDVSVLELVNVYWLIYLNTKVNFTAKFKVFYCKRPLNTLMFDSKSVLMVTRISIIVDSYLCRFLYKCT